MQKMKQLGKENELKKDYPDLFVDPSESRGRDSS
jgi:hypothetical protein